MWNYLGLIDLVFFSFPISTINIRCFGNGALYLFYFNFMKLSQSFDLICEFNSLIQIDSGHFFLPPFLIDFISISSFNMGWLKIEFRNLFFYFLQGYPDLMTWIVSLTS